FERAHRADRRRRLPDPRPRLLSRAAAGRGAAGLYSRRAHIVLLREVLRRLSHRRRRQGLIDYASGVRVVVVHLIDATFELFRYFLSPAAAFDRSAPEELRAVRGVVGSVLGILEGGATHLGVATDHVIESFRNARWPG